MSETIEEKTREKRSKDYYCTYCGKSYVILSFYNSYSMLTKGNDNKLWICKKCIVDLYDSLVLKYDDEKFSVFKICQMLDMYYDEVLAKSLVEQKDTLNTSVIKLYIQKINSLPQYSNKDFSNSAVQTMKVKNSLTQEEFKVLDAKDLENMNEVIELIKYDPFADSNADERPFLYNTILNYLDESTVGDSFKLSAVIEVTKMFSQLDIMNNVISNLTKDTVNLESQSGKLKQLMEIKKMLTMQIMSFAKENRLTSSKQDGSTKGSDTLSGKLKELREKKIKPVDENFFDIKTSEAFIKIAEISNKSIASQLMFDENDYATMLKEQREKMMSLDKSNKSLEENLRLSKEENEYLKQEIVKLGGNTG